MMNMLEDNLRRAGIGKNYWVFGFFRENLFGGYDGKCVLERNGSTKVRGNGRVSLMMANRFILMNTC